MWFISLIVLAIAAFLIVKAVKASSQRRKMDQPAESTEASLSGPQRDTDADGSATDAKDAVSRTSEDANPGAAAHTMQPDNAQDPATEQEIREMIKTLNLAESDAPRLGISGEQFNSLRHGEKTTDYAALPDTETQQDVANRLRRMLS